MRALLLEGAGLQGLRMGQTPDPAPAPGKTVVALRAAALNHRDLWACRGWKPGAKPVVLGSDGAGVVAAVGTGVTDLPVGAEVVVNPSLHWPAHQPFPGPDFEILGNPSHGTFAEQVVVPRQNVFPKPPHLSFISASRKPRPCRSPL